MAGDPRTPFFYYWNSGTVGAVAEGGDTLPTLEHV